MWTAQSCAAINPQGWYNPTNGRWTPTVAGYYEVNLRWMFRNSGMVYPTTGYVGIFKNGAMYCSAFDDGASFCCPEIGTLVYMNGTTDYLQTAVSMNTGATVQLNSPGAQEWDISLVNQQQITNTNTGNYRISASGNNDIPTLLSSNVPVITDVANNIYVITNSSSSAITLTAGNYTGYELFGAFFTSATSVTMPAGSVLELMSITPGTDYQVVTMSQPTVNGAVAFGGYCSFSAPANAQTTVTNYVTNYNPQNYFNPATGRFTPKTAGYYQINCVASGQAGGFVGAAIIKNGSITASPWCYNDTGGGNFSSVTPSCVTYMNGSTDYLQVQVAPGATGKTILVVFDGYLSCQTNTQVVGTTASARIYQLASQAIATGTMTKVSFGAATFDPQSWASLSNSRITPTIPGYYQVNAHLECSLTVLSAITCNIFKNGGNVSRNFAGPAGQTGFNATSVSDVIYMNGTTDYLEVYFEQGTGVSANIAANQATNFFSVELVGANQAVPAVTPTRMAITTGTGSAGDYCVTQLDNIKAWFRGNAGTQLFISTVAGTQTIFIDTTVNNYGGGAGFDSWPSATNTPQTLTTTGTGMWSTSSAGRWEMNIRSTDGSGRVWKITYTISHGYVNSYVMIERLF